MLLLVLMMEVYIPSFRHEESELERGYTVRGPAGRGAAGPADPAWVFKSRRAVSANGSGGCEGVNGRAGSGRAAGAPAGCGAGPRRWSSRR